MSYEKLSPPIPSDFPDEWYHYNVEHHFWFAWRLRALRQLLADNALSTRAALKGLDIGSGVAFFRSQVEAMTAWTIDACDVNESALQNAAPARGRTLLYNVADRQPAFMEHYDVIFLFDVLEHIENPAGFLEAALWHLKPGGSILLNVPALPSLYSRYDQLVGHYVRYTAASMRALLAPLPLTIRDMRYWGFSLLPIAWLRNLAVRSSRTPDEVVKAGFKISSGWINQSFLAASRIETTLLHHPPVGTSLMVLLTKN